MKKKYGRIYMAKNITNNKVYIGQTTQRFEARKKQHENDAKNDSNYYFHRALNKYGFGNFDWTILEDRIPESNLIEKEKMYIKKYDSYKSGYNSTEGGENPPTYYGEKHPGTSLTKEKVNRIRELLLNSSLGKQEIANITNTPLGTVDGINHGRSWFEENLSYPLKENVKEYLSTSEVIEIVALLKEEKISMRDIAKKYKVAHSTIKGINNGIYHKGLVEKHAQIPVRAKTVKINKGGTKLTQENVKQIIQLLQKSNLTDNEIGLKYDVTRKTVANINNGKTWSNLYNGEHPIRKTPTYFTIDKNIALKIIKELKETRRPQTEIAKEYNIDTSVIYSINLGSSWKDLYGDDYPIRKKQK